MASLFEKVGGMRPGAKETESKKRTKEEKGRYTDNEGHN